MLTFHSSTPKKYLPAHSTFLPVKRKCINIEPRIKDAQTAQNISMKLRSTVTFLTRCLRWKRVIPFHENEQCLERGCENKARDKCYWKKHDPKSMLCSAVGCLRLANGGDDFCSTHADPNRQKWAFLNWIKTVLFRGKCKRHACFLLGVERVTYWPALLTVNVTGGGTKSRYPIMTTFHSTTRISCARYDRQRCSVVGCNRFVSFGGLRMWHETNQCSEKPNCTKKVFSRDKCNKHDPNRQGFYRKHVFRMETSRHRLEWTCQEKTVIVKPCLKVTIATNMRPKSNSRCTTRRLQSAKKRIV